jgi:AcrR family transcriptional regulator
LSQKGEILIKDFFNCEHGVRMPGDKRREQILRSAIELFSQRGFSGTTTKEIAKAAGVSEAMVFRHFSKKSEIYDAIIDNKACHEGIRFPWEENKVVQEAIKNKDDHAVFYNLALNALTKQQEDESFMRLLFYSALEEHELAERFFRDFVAQLYEFIGGYIERRQKDGAMRKVNPRIVVRAFLGMMIHHSLNNILWDKKRRLLNITNEEAAKNFAEILLRGIKN